MKKPRMALFLAIGVAAGGSASAQERITIPAVASVVGADPFFSDVRMFNTSSSDIEVRATYRCFLAACPATAPQETFTLAPRESRAFDDMINLTFDAPGSAGGVELDVLSGGTASDIVVTSRLYSTEPVPTVGMFVPGVTAAAAHRYSVLTQIANGGEGEGFRTNVGAFNGGDTAATVVFAVYWDGHWVGQVERAIPGHSGTQVNNIFGAGGINHPLIETSDAVVTAQTNGPPVFSYAAVIDSNTTDPIFVRGAADAAPVLSVGGLFETHVTLGENTCTPVPTVMDNPTTVVQTPGSHTMSLAHAGITYDGTVNDDGSFAMQPENVGGQFTITITGQFTPQGFSAVVRVEQAAPACFYVVDWQGLKQDGANFFP
jgi:hypothetical protein